MIPRKMQILFLMIHLLTNPLQNPELIQKCHPEGDRGDQHMSCKRARMKGILSSSLTLLLVMTMLAIEIPVTLYNVMELVLLKPEEDLQDKVLGLNTVLSAHPFIARPEPRVEIVPLGKEKVMTVATVHLEDPNLDQLIEATKHLIEVLPFQNLASGMRATLHQLMAILTFSTRCGRRDRAGLEMLPVLLMRDHMLSGTKLIMKKPRVAAFGGAGKNDFLETDEILNNVVVNDHELCVALVNIQGSTSGKNIIGVHLS